VDRLKKKDLFVNIHFNNIYANRLGILYLYYKLRQYAIERGGSFKGYNFTKSERYNVLPKLVKEGMINGDKIVSYRSLCTKLGCKGMWSSMEFCYLNDMKTLRGFILGATECYILDRNYKRQNKQAKKYTKSLGYQQMDWVKSGGNSWHNVKKISSDDNEGCLMGRVFANRLSKITGLSTRTISRWRKDSPNIYRYNKYTPEKAPVPGRDRDKFTRTKAGFLITADLYIISMVEVFSTGSYDGNTMAAPKLSKKAENAKNVLKNPNTPILPLFPITYEYIGLTLSKDYSLEELLG
jgi:hypothetical protein